MHRNMYTPHLVTRSDDPSASSRDGSSLLDELDRIAPLKQFDAFPKVEATYISQSRRGGVLTAMISCIIFLLTLNDLGEYLYGAPEHTFRVDPGLERDLQLNVDLTVAMPCHCM